MAACKSKEVHRFPRLALHLREVAPAREGKRAHGPGVDHSSMYSPGSGVDDGEIGPVSDRAKLAPDAVLVLTLDAIL